MAPTIPMARTRALVQWKRAQAHLATRTRTQTRDLALVQEAKGHRDLDPPVRKAPRAMAIGMRKLPKIAQIQRTAPMGATRGDLRRAGLGRTSLPLPGPRRRVPASHRLLRRRES